MNILYVITYVSYVGIDNMEINNIKANLCT